MGNIKNGDIIDDIVGRIDIPDSSYERAAQRYKDFAAWLERPESRCGRFRPYVYPQGSFRLGTVVRPLDEDDEYDLDMGCRLTSGITMASHTQRAVKDLVGDDLESYRIARRITEQREEKARCWRLRYADNLKFHLDAVPSIPEVVERKHLLVEAMKRSGIDEVLAGKLAAHSGAITDNRLLNYDQISDKWRVSNSEGYARWFESRMKLAGPLLEGRALEARVGKVDDLPVYRWKSPLQCVVQLLKRHRDVMFRGEVERKPVSVIITTLAARAYGGEADIRTALEVILAGMGGLVSPTPPRVANPVYPAEDFADKWSDPARRHLSLEASFWRWLEQAKSDFDLVGSARSPEELNERSQRVFALGFSRESATQLLVGGSGGMPLREVVVPSGLTFPPKPLNPSKPAGFASA